ncbi:MAG: hypothetical protein Q3M30_04870 [Candidatus Electrothrix sp. Rat3]|nr:hypothetical protein [Candidatus Electrothrix rattekaaiensis]
MPSFGWRLKKSCNKANKQYKSARVPFSPGMEMTFFFDFGDCWKFHVQVEETDSDTTDSSEPVILEHHGKAPEQYPDYGEW